MYLITDWEKQGDVPRLKTVFSIGVFDGLHLGHRYLIDKVIKNAERLKAQSLVLTFSPHPLEILAKQAAPPVLTTIEQKADLLAQWGLGRLGILRFSREMAAVEPKKFLYQFLGKFFEPAGAVLGPDLTFGKDARGNADTISAWLKECSPRAKVQIVEPKLGPYGPYSSSQIRQDLKDGLVESAAQALGRPYRLDGMVVHGQARGRTLGFPTANLGQFSQLTPGPGVYAVEVTVEGQLFKGMTSIGYNPTFGEQPMTVETNIFEFNKFIYGFPLTLRFIVRLRDMVKFSSAELLAIQLDKDRTCAKYILSH